jgi:hypothetical protein
MVSRSQGLIFFFYFIVRQFSASHVCWQCVWVLTTLNMCSSFLSRGSESLPRKMLRKRKKGRKAIDTFWSYSAGDSQQLSV